MNNKKPITCPELEIVLQTNQLSPEGHFVNEKNYTPTELVLRRFLNDGETSMVFLGLDEIQFQKTLNFIYNNLEKLYQNNQLSTNVYNNHSCILWTTMEDLKESLIAFI